MRINKILKHSAAFVAMVLIGVLFWSLVFRAIEIESSYAYVYDAETGAYFLSEKGI